MKNITIAVGDDLYRHARICAAQRDTSVTALIRLFLTNLEYDPGRRARTILGRIAAFKDHEASGASSQSLTPSSGG